MTSTLARMAGAFLILSSSAASAQDIATADWETHRDERRDLTAAYLPTTTGINLLFRCEKGAFTGFLSGLPQQDGEQRDLEVAFGDEPLRNTQWTSGSEGTSAFSDYPAPFARKMRGGGRFQVRVQNGSEDGRPVRYVIDLPPSNVAIDQALQACGRPLVDPRDAEIEAVGENGLPTALEWVQRPRPSFPNTRYARGFATVSCIASPQGRARDCVIETEHPFDGRFGKATLDAMGAVRLRNRLNPDAEIPPSRFVFRVNYIMEGYATREDQQRAREAAAARRNAPD
jgi:hypothetical protein